MAKINSKVLPKKAIVKADTSHKFEPVNFDSIFPVLDAIAFLDFPETKEVAQFAGIDPRTAGKILKNVILIGAVQELNGAYSLSLPYPYKGTRDEKKTVVRESLIKLPLLVNVKQFLKLGDKLDDSLRKSATIIGIKNYNAADFSPLIKLAQQLNALDLTVIAEDLVDEATQLKEVRHHEQKQRKIAFISHSSKDKPIIRQLAADLVSEGIEVWLDEQKILVGESISEKIGQGLAQSDYFIIAISQNSNQSEWVKKELNNAVIKEIENRKTTILPIKLNDAEIPLMLRDKKYADFTISYKQGLADILNTIKNGK